MPYVKVGGTELDIDVQAELAEFDWVRPRWTPDKLIAASPFRYDQTPSFFVNLDGEYAGTFADSGAYDEDYEKGNLIKLLAFLRSETYEETEDYLRYKYGLISDEDTFKVSLPSLKKERKRIVLEETELSEHTKRHSYLSNRGISGKVEAFFNTRYFERGNAVIIPWRHPDGQLANLKFRKVRGKAFWYIRGGHPIRELVFGLDKVHAHSLTEVFVCEAEIDALSIWTQGKPAIALGSASISRKQVDAIKRSPIERLVIASDSDKAGEKLARMLTKEFSGKVELSRLELPEGVKDVNEALVKGVLDVEKQTKISPPAFRLNLV